MASRVGLAVALRVGLNSGFESGTNIALMVGLIAAKQRVGLMVAKRGTNIDKKWD